MSTAPASIQPHTRMNPNNRACRISSDGSGSMGEMVTPSATAMIITAIRTFSRARPTTPRQKTSFLRTTHFNRLNTA